MCVCGATLARLSGSAVHATGVCRKRKFTSSRVSELVSAGALTVALKKNAQSSLARVNFQAAAQTDERARAQRRPARNRTSRRASMTFISLALVALVALASTTTAASAAASAAGRKPASARMYPKMRNGPPSTFAAHRVPDAAAHAQREHSALFQLNLNAGGALTRFLDWRFHERELLVVAFLRRTSAAQSGHSHTVDIAILGIPLVAVQRNTMPSGPSRSPRPTAPRSTWPRCTAPASGRSPTTASPRCRRTTLTSRRRRSASTRCALRRRAVPPPPPPPARACCSSTTSRRCKSRRT